LPQEKIADPHLAAGADEEVRVREVMGPEILGEEILGDLLRFQVPVPAVGHDSADGLENIVPPPITQGQGKRHPLVLGRFLHGLLEDRLDLFGQPDEIPDGHKPDVVVQHLLELGFQVVLEEDHQRIDLQAGPAPVFGRKSEESQKGDSDLPGDADDPPDRLRSLAMSFHPVQGPLFRPTPIPVHDDGQMVRELFFHETMHRQNSQGSLKKRGFSTSTKCEISIPRSAGPNPK
jgi:hypothetical protein